MPDQKPAERVINIREPYLELIADGTKTVEVRVGYPNMRRIAPGQLLRFTAGPRHVRARVIVVIEYESFEALLDAEDTVSIGGEGMSHEELLAICREIYPPEKEALGVLAIHIEQLRD